MKRRLIIILISILAIAIGTAIILPFAMGGEEPVMEELAKLTEKDIPTQVYAWLNQDREREGYAAFFLEDNLYLAARLGQRPTGGYAVLLGDAVLEGNEVRVRVQLKSPKPWDMVTQVITYPRTVVKIDCGGSMPANVLFLSSGNTVLAKVPIVNLREELGGD